MGYCSAWYIGSFCFVTARVFKLLLRLYTEAWTRTNCSLSRQRVNGRRVFYFYELYPLFGCQNVSSLLLSNSSQTESLNFLLNFCHLMSFYALQIFFEMINCTFAKEFDKTFWVRLKEINFCFCGKKDWNTWRVERFVCSSSKRFDYSSRSEILKILRACIRCLYNNVIDRLFVATSESTNDRRVQTLRLDTNQLFLIWNPTVH